MSLSPEVEVSKEVSQLAAMESWSRELDLRALAERFGTPLYLHHPATLRERFELYARLVGDPGNVRYPIKANPSPVVVEALAEWGSGADCASRHEIQTALAAGIPIGRIAYNTPAPELEIALWLLRAGGSVVADSADFLGRLGKALDGAAPAGRLYVRVNPGGLPGYQFPSEVQKYTDHGSARSQFGVPSEDLPALVEKIELPVGGLHVHVGTQMDNLETFVAGLDYLHHLADVLAERGGLRIEALNLGGGLGIPFQTGQSFPSVEGLVATLAPRLRPGIRYEVEPGNSLVGDTMALLTRVVALKEGRGRRWAIVDVGTDQLVKFTVARWEHEIVDADHRPLEREGPDGLSGPLCFAGDVFLPETRLQGVRAGDPMLIRHAGAYCESVASRFNGRRAPAQVVIEAGGEPRLVRRSEDLFYEPGMQTHLAVEGPQEDPPAEVLPGELVRSLHSAYMHELAEGDGYEITGARRTGGRSYVFELTTRATVDFVAMPLALRIIGDCAIIAVGHQLGWREKAGPVWATRLTMNCGETIPAGETVECRIRVSALAPSPQPNVAAMGAVHYSLAGGRFTGTARVVVPAS